jgi:ATPase subunit of ABC transporter with duplicated ATPase domains
MLEQEQHNQQVKYVSHLSHLLKQEKLSDRVNHRRQQKKNQGRLRELGRMTSRQRLNSKRSWAQESQTRVDNIAKDRRNALSEMVKAARRQLNTSLPLTLYVPKVSEVTNTTRTVLESVSVEGLFSDLSLSLTRQRVAITGDNGVGKTSLIQLMLGQKKPDSGVVEQTLEQVGYVAQNANNWKLKQSLFEYLWGNLRQSSNEDIMGIIIAHKFPLGLAERPMRDLSPGERLRAALICLFACAHQYTKPLDYLVLDEPNVSLDEVAFDALRQALTLWKGGLIIVSHNEQFLSDLDIDVRIYLSDEKLTIADNKLGL